MVIDSDIIVECIMIVDENGSVVDDTVYDPNGGDYEVSQGQTPIHLKLRLPASMFSPPVVGVVLSDKGGGEIAVSEVSVDGRKLEL